MFKPFRAYLAALALLTVLGTIHSPACAQSNRQMDKEDIDRLVKELSNWGRWGADDELGALNLITPAKRKAAVTLVREGLSVSLAHVPVTEPASDNPQPFEHRMIATGLDASSPWAMDNYSVSYHGLAHTHMDSLCHLFYDGRMYNGYDRQQVRENGAMKLSIHNVQKGIFTRAVLFDLPRLRGVEYLEAGSPIYPDELSAWENRSGAKVTAGDVVFIRTGRWARRAKRGPWDPSKDGMAGLHASCGAWLKQRDVAMLGSDAASDVIPSQVPGVTHPIHVLTLHAMGVHIFDNCDLEDVAKVAARLRRWDFLLTAAPIPVEGGTGSPLNPIATF